MPTPIENNIISLNTLKTKVRNLSAIESSIISEEDIRHIIDGTASRIVFPEGITQIKKKFINFISLTEVSLPNSLTHLYGEAFYGCINLDITALPENLVYLGDYVFNGCSKISNVWIPQSCKTIIADIVAIAPFCGCTNLSAIYTDALSKLDGWGPYFNYIDDVTQVPVYYGVSKEKFETFL